MTISESVDATAKAFTLTIDLVLKLIVIGVIVAIIWGLLEATPADPKVDAKPEPRWSATRPPVSLAARAYRSAEVAAFRTVALEARARKLPKDEVPAALMRELATAQELLGEMVNQAPDLAAALDQVADSLEQ